MLELSTPTMVYSEDALASAVDHWRQGLGADAMLLFALKSCYRPPVLRALKALGCWTEVMTPMEYELAVHCGYAPEEILINGIGRSREFLERTVRDGCRVVVDSYLELQFLCEIDHPARLGIRVRPPMASTRQYARASKLGLELGSPDLETLLAKIPSHLGLELIHCHIASQETRADIFLEALDHVAPLVSRIPTISALNLGGGWETAKAVPVEEFQRLRSAFHSRFPDLCLWLEPGRSLVNGAGFVVTTVVGEKTSQGRNYLVLDASTSTLMSHKEATYELLYPASGKSYKADLVDGISSLTSLIKGDVCFAVKPRVGDKIVLGNCGAYTSSMAQFWAFSPMEVRFLDSQGVLHDDLRGDDILRARQALLGF